jgi:23S rRNA (pseudouridine1915-N3)-methyltransferase
MKNPALRALAEEYAGRIARFTTFEVVELRDGKAVDGAARLAEEAKAIATDLAKGAGLANAVLLDERGDAPDTPAFARLLDKAMHRAPVLDFVIGSSHGVDPVLKKKIPVHLRLSSLTLTHEWAWAFSLEQVYRAFCVLKGLPYHH